MIRLFFQRGGFSPAPLFFVRFMKLLQRWPRQKKQLPTAYSLVDVGRDTVKAAVVLVIPPNPEPQVVGYGLAKTNHIDITGGRNAAEAVVGPVNQALTQAEASTERYLGRKIVPDDVIFAIAGRAAIGQLVTVEQIRPKSLSPITAKEIVALRQQAVKLVPAALAEAAVDGGQWQPLSITDAGTWLDSRRVAGQVEGLTGRKLTHAVLGVGVYTSALRGLEVLAEQLDLNLANVVASPHALAALAPSAEAIILDMGFSGPDICLIKNDALVAMEWIPFGGHFFSQSLAQAMAVPLPTALALKHNFGQGTLSPERAQQVEANLETAYERWYNGVMEILTGFLADEPLPRKIYLTGGASQMPHLDRLLKVDPAPFEAVPEVTWLTRPHLAAIKDLTDSLDYHLLALTLGLTIGIPE
jgi:cell division ATPase FtsA